MHLQVWFKFEPYLQRDNFKGAHCQLCQQTLLLKNQSRAYVKLPIVSSLLTVPASDLIFYMTSGVEQVGVVAELRVGRDVT